jgi:hypothetical protein
VACRHPTTDRQHAGRLYAPTMMRVALASTEQFEVAVERDQRASVSQLAETGTKKNEPVKPEPYRDDGSYVSGAYRLRSYRLPCDRCAGLEGPCPGAGAATEGRRGLTRGEQVSWTWRLAPVAISTIALAKGNGRDRYTVTTVRLNSPASPRQSGSERLDVGLSDQKTVEGIGVADVMGTLGVRPGNRK